MKLFAALILLCSAQCAFAQSTCINDVCSITENGVERPMTREETSAQMRSNARTAIGNINCRYASDQQACEGARKALFMQFPL